MLQIRYLLATNMPNSIERKIIHFVVNTYYKNRQKILNDEIRKDTVKTFKSIQRTKENRICLCITYLEGIFMLALYNIVTPILYTRLLLWCQYYIRTQAKISY